MNQINEFYVCLAAVLYLSTALFLSPGWTANTTEPSPVQLPPLKLYRSPDANIDTASRSLPTSTSRIPSYIFVNRNQVDSSPSRLHTTAPAQINSTPNSTINTFEHKSDPKTADEFGQNIDQTRHLEFLTGIQPLSCRRAIGRVINSVTDRALPDTHTVISHRGQTVFNACENVRDVGMDELRLGWKYGRYNREFTLDYEQDRHLKFRYRIPLHSQPSIIMDEEPLFPFHFTSEIDF